MRMFLFQVTAVCFTEKADNIMSGGIDNHIKMWDLKHGEVCTYDISLRSMEEISFDQQVLSSHIIDERS